LRPVPERTRNKPFQKIGNIKQSIGSPAVKNTKGKKRHRPPTGIPRSGQGFEGGGGKKIAKKPFRQKRSSQGDFGKECSARQNKKT